jgi:hypothetical protein
LYYYFISILVSHSDIEKSTLAEFAALNALSNNANLTALCFEMAELSAVEHDIFMFFHTLSPFYAKIWGDMVEFLDAVFLPGVRMNGACLALNRM